MSYSLRDQRGRVYAQSNTGSPGWANNKYTFAAEWWVRVEAPTGRERLVGERETEAVDAVIAFADEATVPSRSLIVVAAGSMAGTYRTLTVLPRRRGREIHVPVVRVDAAAYALAES